MKSHILYSGILIVALLALAWACRFQSVGQLGGSGAGVPIIINRWTGQAYYLSTPSIKPFTQTNQNQP